MNRKDLLTILQNQTNIIWDSLCEMYLPLTAFNPPVIELNGRFYKTAGRCHQEDNVIQLGTKFFEHSIEYRDIMTEIILPYNLYGDSEAKCGHGKRWQEIMINYGLEANPYHKMEIKR